ncbi:hypothetical protein SLEP1_g33343 [Rubroshorea leprosula]|uniref:Cytochrome b5 heme-binding domain-containing protein n=1 Tax=Rubroshorea leprosula TaxID=152421 RepID=A0AAV5KGD9_9ROSI|nr:hypothetical protein SLEP1_g33343 [Rubroshorea leprosula]
MGFYSTAMDAVMEYTGLSPAGFFTILALMVVVYKMVCGMFVGPEEFDQKHREITMPGPAAVPEPVQLGDVTEEELRAYDGSDPRKPLLMAIKGQIYDVSRSRMFYGPGGPYAMFTGRDPSRALALMSFNREDLTGNIEGLSSDELEVLQDWEYKFMEKYEKVGRIVLEKSTNNNTENGGNIKEKENGAVEE